MNLGPVRTLSFIGGGRASLQPKNRSAVQHHNRAVHEFGKEVFELRKKTGKIAALLAAISVAVAAFAPAAGADPKPFSGYFKDVNGGGNGASECAGPHQAQLPPGQGKKC